jgi:hypothetical protein
MHWSGLGGWVVVFISFRAEICCFAPCILMISWLGKGISYIFYTIYIFKKFDSSLLDDNYLLSLLISPDSSCSKSLSDLSDRDCGKFELFWIVFELPWLFHGILSSLYWDAQVSAWRSWSLGVSQRSWGMIAISTGYQKHLEGHLDLSDGWYCFERSLNLAVFVYLCK